MSSVIIVRMDKSRWRKRGSILSPWGWRFLVEFMTLAIGLVGVLFLYVVL